MGPGSCYCPWHFIYLGLWGSQPQILSLHSWKMCVLRSVWFFAAPGTVACQVAPLAVGFSRQEYRSGLPCPPPGESSWSRDWTYNSYVSCIVNHHKQKATNSVHFSKKQNKQQKKPVFSWFICSIKNTIFIYIITVIL